MEHHKAFFAEPRSWVAVAFVLFFVLFGRRLWRAITQQLDGRAAAVRAELESAASLRREAEALLRQAQIDSMQAQKDAATMLATSKAEAARLIATAQQEATATGARREKMAMDRIAAAEKAAVSEVRVAAADIAARASERVIRETFTAEADASMIDTAIAGLPASLASRRVA